MLLRRFGRALILDCQGARSCSHHPRTAVTTNLGFGGDDWKTLFVTSRPLHLARSTANSPAPGAGARKRDRSRMEARRPKCLLPIFGIIGPTSGRPDVVPAAIRCRPPQPTLFPHYVPETGTPCGLQNLLGRNLMTIHLPFSRRQCRRVRAASGLAATAAAAAWARSLSAHRPF